MTNPPAGEPPDAFPGGTYPAAPSGPPSYPQYSTPPYPQYSTPPEPQYPGAGYPGVQYPPGQYSPAQYPAQQFPAGTPYPYPPGNWYGGAPMYGAYARPGNGMAVTAMVLGIISLVFFWFPFLDVVLGVLALAFAIQGLRRAGLGASGRGMAIAGLVTGILGILIGIVSTIAIVQS